ncbi:MAG: 30S ribosome-binding factor RbfA [Anaerolineae bacterium]
MSTTKRQGRAAEMIQETLSVLLSQAADERLNTIVITEAEVNQDLSAAKVWYTVNGDENDKKAAQDGLKHAAGFLRTEVAETLDLRRAPTVTFHYDSDALRVERVMDIFNQIEAERKTADESGAASGDGAEANNADA